MNKNYLLLPFFVMLGVFQSIGQNANVTFQVDMSEYTGAFTEVQLNGSFNGWCGDCNPMTDADMDGIWEITLPLAAATYEYKFTFDNWTGQETFAGGESCTSTLGGFTNRSITVAGDVVLDAVCWNSCDACGVVAEDSDVTFQVDMSEYAGTFTEVQLNGTFNGWCGDCNPMTDADMDGIWEATLPLAAGSYEYKFTFDNWTGEETFAGGESCTVTNGGFTNRSITVAGDVVLDAVCWNSCDACGVVAEDSDVTFQVDMSEYAGTFTEVQLNGTFNGWCGDCNPMTDADMDGIWEATLPLAAGSYEYKFTFDNWTGEETFAGGEECTVTIDGFTNRSITVAGDVVLDAVCWNSCDPCGGMAMTSDITFQVDMSEYAGTFTEVQLNGSFNGWCGDCNPMTDADMDGIWEVTLPLAQDTFEYKFTFDNWTGQESFAGGESCTSTIDGFTNRSVIVTTDETLDVVCWNSCDPCSGVPTTADITFQVDMNEFTGSFTEVQLNGSFNGWCGACNPMTDADMDGIWELTLNLPIDTIEYKFTFDNWTDQEVFAGGESCTSTIDGFTNRSHIVTANETLPVVCWNSCDPCGGVPTTANVTFQVDMNEYAGTFTEVQLNGSFNNWCGTCNPMTDADLDGVWELTLNLPLDTVEYKFTVDNWSDSEDFADGDACTSTVDGFVNRSHIVTMDETLNAYCWNECDVCLGVGIEDNEFFETFELSPNPAKDNLSLNLELKGMSDVSLSIVNVMGQTIYQDAYSIEKANLNLDMSSMTNGMYFIVLETKEGSISRRFLIQK